MSTRAVAVVLLLLPSATFADDRAPAPECPSLVAAALTSAHVETFTEQRRRRRGGSVRVSGTRRSFRRIITGASLVVGGVIVARTAHTRIGEMNNRNSVRDEWNAAATQFSEVTAEYDYECRRFSERCLELAFDIVPTLVTTMTTLAASSPFLPQFPDVGLYITREEEEHLYTWFTTESALESTRRWNTTRYGGLAAVGIGALLATIWSDVPAVRNLRVHTTPTRMAVTTAVGW